MSLQTTKKRKSSDYEASQAPLPVFDWIFWVNDFVVFRKYTNEHLFQKHGSQYIDMKVFELSFSTRTHKQKQYFIPPLATNKITFMNIWRTAKSNSRPNLLKYVFKRSKNQHWNAVKKPKLKQRSPVKSIQLNLNGSEKQIGVINKNIEDLNISEIRSEISLVSF